jgi:DNA-binding transcriptional regulator YhcF (GntR family)
MAWELNSDRPIYAQLMEQIQTRIVSGEYPCGQKLPSVRELAAQAAVNPNTMQKAFAELERSGLIVTQRTNGRSVTDDLTLIQQVRRNMAIAHLKSFVINMKKLGYSEQEIEELAESIGSKLELSKESVAAEREEEQ